MVRVILEAASSPLGGRDSSDEGSPSVWLGGGAAGLSSLSLPPGRSEPISSAVLASVSVAAAFAAGPSARAVGFTPVPPWAAWEDPGKAGKVLKCCC
eukprot:1488717-Pyramimonas_sp.AAC.1